MNKMPETLYCKYCYIYFNKKYWVYHKYTTMHIENKIKHKSGEDEYENVLYYLIVQLKSK